jgi:hypothetical protein
MKINQSVIKLVRSSSKGSLLMDQCSGAFLNEITRVAFLAVVLGISMVLATGCTATSKGVSVRMMAPVTRNQEVSYFDLRDSDSLTRSPAFSNFFGS